MSRRSFLALAGSGLLVACGGGTGSTQSEDPSSGTPAASAVPASTSIPETTTLRGWADKVGLQIGTIGGPGGNDPGKFKILKEQFNKQSISSFSMNIVAAQTQGSYDFRTADSLAKLAVQNGQQILGHNLVFGSAGITPGVTSDIPQWLRDGSYSSGQLVSIMQDHIRSVMGHYKGLITEWVVVNEATRQTSWRGKLGPSFVQTAFETARNFDPDATLIYNDFGAEYSGAPKAEQVFTLVKGLHDKGLIDGVGMQFHMIAEGPNINPLQPPSKASVVAEMMRYGELGLGVYVTELDCVSTIFPGTRAEQEQAQAQVFRLPFEAALASQGVCRSIVIWGINDEASWRKDGRPLLYSSNQPKPAFYSVLDVLKNAS